MMSLLCSHHLKITHTILQHKTSHSSTGNIGTNAPQTGRKSLPDLNKSKMDKRFKETLCSHFPSSEEILDHDPTDGGL